MRADLLLRQGPTYRPDAFAAGLTRLGYEVSGKHRRDPRPGDVLILWNRNRGFDAIAANYEARGGRVVIAENGPCGQNAAGAKLYSLAIGQHNGAGRWPVGDAPRFDIQCKPWRVTGDHVLVLPQRGIGIKPVAMPHGWADETVRRLREMTDRPIRVRKHPGAAKTDPWPDLAGAHCAVTWGSGAGIKAIMHGVPVFYDMPSWVGRHAALPLSRNLEQCYCGDRGDLIRQLSWLQWTLQEIQSGEAFAWLLHDKNSDLPRPK
jgi:hypothetical protein